MIYAVMSTDFMWKNAFTDWGILSFIFSYWFIIQYVFTEEVQLLSYYILLVFSRLNGIPKSSLCRKLEFRLCERQEKCFFE